jgi:phosphatidylserine/phosphatidylglycerophosphate/cardiolipin synthase-like enzyme
MSNRTQRTYRVWIVLALLSAAGWLSIASDQITVLPLVGHVESAVYRESVLAVLSGASESVEVMLSSVSVEENPLLPALAEAVSRGVRVRALIDASDWAPEITTRNMPALEYLRSHGVDVRFDAPEVTLHAKLVIVDQESVILGSSNWNHYAFTQHRQSDVLITCPQAAAFYGEYFEIVWSGRLDDQSIELDPFLTSEGAPTILPLADLPGSVTYARVVLNLLQSATQSVHIAMYRMTYYSGYAQSQSNLLMDALIHSAARGLDVKVLIDDCAFYPDSADANLAAAIRLSQHGVEVRLDAAEVTTHTKLLIVDGRSIVLGSTNWNYYALERNCETAIAFLNLPEVALPFEQFFDRLWSEGRELAS